MSGGHGDAGSTGAAAHDSSSLYQQVKGLVPRTLGKTIIRLTTPIEETVNV